MSATMDPLHVACAEALSLCRSMKDDLEALLHPETGFAPRLYKICSERLADLEDEDMGGVTSEMEALEMERNTWSLLQALMPERKTEPELSPTAEALLASNPYTPTYNLAQAILKSSPFLSELVIVREWLHDTAPIPPIPEATTGYLRFTKHSLMQSLRTSSRARDGLVKEMDPDAAHREDGRAFAPDDANHDKALNVALFAHIRAGKLEQAMELCRKAHQPWRAASIRGSLLFQWRALSTDAPDEDAMDDGDAEGWQGNSRRKLWKATCNRAALNTSLSTPERVLYAALAPTASTAAILRQGCRTWEDHLWAQVSVMCEHKETLELERLKRAFWENGVVGSVDPSAVDPVSEPTDWEHESVKALEAMAHMEVDEGATAANAFHSSQLQIILNRTNSLLQSFAEKLSTESLHPSDPQYLFMTRFHAHLCLYLQLIDIRVPPEATQVILEAYLQILENAGQRELIAMYAGALGDNAVERYAAFLVGLGLDANPDERKTALRRAGEEGLDTERVAAVTAERTVDRCLEALPSLEGPLPSAIQPLSDPSEAELLLIRSIEWTIVSDGTYAIALEQACAIIRYFLASGKMRHAAHVLSLLPDGLGPLSSSEDLSGEFSDYGKLYRVWGAMEKVVECGSREITSMTRDGTANWRSEYETLLNQAREQTLDLLNSDWLVEDVEIFTNDKRRHALIRIRQIYIPELILRLHGILLQSRHQVSKSLVYAFDLTNIVADSRYKLYADFGGEGGRQLGEYVDAVRTSVLAGLENGGSNPFRLLEAP